MSPRLIGMASALAALLLLTGAIYWKGREAGLAHERPKTAAAQAQAAVASLETQGARESAARVDVVIRRRESADHTVVQITPEALDAEDAHAPLDPERADRLRLADDQLCLSAPALAGCSTDNDAD